MHIKRMKSISSSVILNIFLIALILNSISISQSTGFTFSEIYADTDNDKFISQIESEYNPFQYTMNGYTPVTNVTDTGSNLVFEDILTVNHDFSLNLTYEPTFESFIDSFSIDDIIDYTPYSHLLNITSITAKRDNYTIEEDSSDSQIINEVVDVYAIAQGFNVPWNNAKFFGAYMSLNYSGGGTVQSCELDLYLVKADVSGKPNMSKILSLDPNSPYTAANPYNVGLDYYDFNDVVLDKGYYFIVANLSVSVASPKVFTWMGDSIAPYNEDTFYLSGTGIWSSSPENIDHTLILDLLPSDIGGNPRSFSDLTEIYLEDGGTVINSFTDYIYGTGVHDIISDTSIEISFNNSYVYYSPGYATSDFLALNSTLDSYSIFWDIYLEINNTDISPYNNLNRTVHLSTPSDWNSTFTCYYNLTQLLSGSKTQSGYIINLESNDIYGNLTFSTTSLNFINQISFSDEFGLSNTYTLGNWTTDGETAYGHNGSTIYSSLLLDDTTTSGYMNFTIFNSLGEINPLKSSLDLNLSYDDLSDYSLGSISSTSPGLFSSAITFDPSVYGTDIAGSWTAFALWQNGTEVGVFSKKINVIAPTRFNVLWEDLPDSDLWITGSGDIILRKNGDPLELQSIYSDISEPYIDGIGFALANSTITYTTSWGETGNFTNNAPNYNLTLSTDITALTYHLNFVASGDTVETKLISLDLEIFNNYRIETTQSYLEVNSTDNAVVAFSIINETDPAEGIIFSDSVSLYINSDLVSAGFYTQGIDGNNTILSIRVGSYGITEGTANVSVAVTKAGFRSGYLNEIVKLDFEVKMIPVGGFELPYYYYIIIAGAAVLILTMTLYLITTSKSRKQRKSISAVDVSDQSKIVGLLDSVLSMKKILIIHSETSLPVFELDISPENHVETTLVSGFLSVVAQMGKTIGGSLTGDIRKLEYKNFVVNSVSAPSYTVFLFSTEDIIVEFNAKLFDFIMWFEYLFEIKGEIWDGRTEMFEDKRKLVEDKAAETLYLWIYFPVEIISRKKSDVKKLENINPKIAQYIMKKEQVLLSELITTFQEEGLEEVLKTYFKLVNKGYLRRRQFMSFGKQ